MLANKEDVYLSNPWVATAIMGLEMREEALRVKELTLLVLAMYQADKNAIQKAFDEYLDVLIPNRKDIEKQQMEEFLKKAQEFFKQNN
ncbi:MAG: hypothetical protein P3W91_003155 [Fervidobacterium sp.]|nr:hypothetical protein [Fervidobacterium sp.]